jgi:hypothetical protein
MSYQVLHEREFSITDEATADFWLPTYGPNNVIGIVAVQCAWNITAGTSPTLKLYIQATDVEGSVPGGGPPPEYITGLCLQSNDSALQNLPLTIQSGNGSGNRMFVEANYPAASMASLILIPRMLFKFVRLELAPANVVGTAAGKVQVVTLF